MYKSLVILIISVFLEKIVTVYIKGLPAEIYTVGNQFFFK